MLRAPRLLDDGALGGPGGERLAACGEEFRTLGEDREGILRIAAQVLHRGGEVGAGGRQRLPVRRDLVLVARSVGGYGALAHRRAADDERRTLRLGIGGDERSAELVDVVSVDRQHVPAPRLVLHRHVLAVHLVDLGRELDVVRIVVHDEVRKPQVTGDAAHALRDLLLDGAVRDVGIGLVRHPLAEARRHEAFGDGCAQRHGMPLTQRARGVLHAAHHIRLRVAGRHAAPLPQRLQIVDRIVTGERQSRIEHRRHVTRVEEEPVAERIRHVRGIVAQELGIEHGDEVGTAHRAAGMARLGPFHHRGRQNADVVGDTLQFGIGRHNLIRKVNFSLHR